MNPLSGFPSRFCISLWLMKILISTLISECWWYYPWLQFAKYFKCEREREREREIESKNGKYHPTSTFQTSWEKKKLGIINNFATCKKGHKFFLQTANWCLSERTLYFLCHCLCENINDVRQYKKCVYLYVDR